MSDRFIGVVVRGNAMQNCLIDSIISCFKLFHIGKTGGTTHVGDDNLNCYHDNRNMMNRNGQL